VLLAGPAQIAAASESILAESKTSACIAAAPENSGDGENLAGRAQPAVLPAAQQAHAVSEPSAHKRRIALALGGGGAARGAAHIGVLRVFEQEKIPIDFIVGTSMGAIVGGLYSAGVPLDRIDGMLHDKSLLRAYDTVPIPVRVAIEPAFAFCHLLGKKPYEGLYRGNKFAHFINDFVDEDQREIANSKIPFWATGTDLVSGKVFIIKNGNRGRAVQASSAIPFLRRPVPMQGALLVDGGVLANVPTLEARQTGADIVIAVDVDEEILNVSEGHFRRSRSVPNRTLSLILAAMDKQRVEAADLTLRPDVRGMPLLSTSVPAADRAIKAGEKVARENLEKIRLLMNENEQSASR
jgi:NTE family protein